MIQITKRDDGIVEWALVAEPCNEIGSAMLEALEGAHNPGGHVGKRVGRHMYSVCAGRRRSNATLVLPIGVG